MEKGSAPPIEQYNYQQGPPPAANMPAAPPSYEQTMLNTPQAAGYAPPPGPAQMYPPVPPPDSVKGPDPAMAAAAASAPVIIQQVQYVQAPSFGTRPLSMVCNHCQQSITTATDSEPSALAWILGCVLCSVGLWMCACIPCCVDSMNQVTHKCPNCRKVLGRYRGGL